MKKMTLLLLFSVLISNCAQHRGYDTAQFREREYETGKITLTQEGLTQEQIQAISSTRRPTNFPIDVSLIIIKNQPINNELEQLYVSKMLEELKKSEMIKRIVPVPKYILPERVNFPVIQELGIRTLTEYVILFILDEETFFRWTKILETRFEITSAVDFLVIDSQTTAILASDRLFSQITYEESIFKVGEKKKAQEEIFTEQGQFLGEKLNLLFSQ